MWSFIRLLVVVPLWLFFLMGDASAQDEVPILWSSTGGGWRAMFADIGYANVFQQAGLFTPNSSRFEAVSTVSGGSWFSTQLVFSPEFYNQTVLAETPDDVYDFVIKWMNTYYNISSDVDDDTRSTCNTTELEENPNYDPERDIVGTFQDICYLLVQFDFDWAFFIQSMLDAAAKDYGDDAFVDIIALPENRIEPMQQTDLLVQAALVPNAQLRTPDPDWSTAVYLGHNNDKHGGDGSTKLFTVPLSAAYVVDDTGSRFWYGFEDRTDEVQTYTANTPEAFSWLTWSPFYLFFGYDFTTDTGNIEINDDFGTTQKGGLQTPFGGPEATTAVQAAAVSSAAGGNFAPSAPSVYTQTFSILYFVIEENKTRTVWRVLAGCAAGIGTTLVAYFLTSYFGFKLDLCREKASANRYGILVGVLLGALVGLLTGLFYGLGSILVPTVYDAGVAGIYKNSTFDNFAVCSQWPNTCGEQDAFMIDGWFIDNPAVVINVGHYQQKYGAEATKGTTIKVIITNTNEAWNTSFNYAQILQYWNTSFNEGVEPGGFLWAPGYYAPFRSPQIFEEYVDEAALDAKLEPIPGTNFTTARLQGTTLDNPSFGTSAGMTVEILLLNLNENITTFVIGRDVVANLTPPLAEMARNVAASEVLVQRVRDFAG